MTTRNHDEYKTTKFKNSLTPFNQDNKKC